MIRNLVPAIAMLAAACVADSPYVSPTGSSLATLIIESAHTDPFLVYTFKDAQNCEAKLTVHEGIRAGVSATVQVRADEPFTVGVAGSRGIQDERKGRIRGLESCHAAITFHPSASRRYVARYRWSGDTCSFVVFEQVETADRRVHYVPEKTQRLRNGCRL